MLHEFFRWIQENVGATASADSWSQQFRGSLNLWGLTEGTHVLTLMVFAGSIWLVDLRLMGLAFKSTPFSKLNDKVLPYTVASFLVLLITGIALFLAKPMDYYHNVWFRGKMVFLVIAAANIFWFHFKVQKNQDEWDAADKTPVVARLSGAVSLSSWVIVILLGRFIAYNWYDCGKPLPGFVNWFAECASTSSGIVEASAAAPLTFPGPDVATGSVQVAREQ